jgi:methylthioribose-1-phosphate isomerase
MSVNMCEGLVKLEEQAKKEGENRAFVEAAENVAKNFHVSIQEACEKLGKSYETYLQIKESLENN